MCLAKLIFTWSISFADLKIIRIQIYLPGLKAKLSFIFMIIHSLLKQNINPVMLSGDGNENGKKKKRKKKINTLFILFQNIVFSVQEGRRQDFSEFSKSPYLSSTFQTSFRCPN